MAIVGVILGVTLGKKDGGGDGPTPVPWLFGTNSLDLSFASTQFDGVRLDHIIKRKGDLINSNKKYTFMLT